MPDPSTQASLDNVPARAGAPGLARAAGTSAWALYTLIVLEILFMVSPFAAYYYAAYAAPLNLLADSPRVAWLTQQVLPHFTWSDSPLVGVLIASAWPLIIAGLVLFLWGFGQIYRARFTGRGPVTGGLYRHIRHPQYLALAVVGLGTTLYWSRFLVISAYVTMLFLYGMLARLEERRCLARFGDPYRDYLHRTGRFLPRAAEQALAHLVRRGRDPSPNLLWHALAFPLVLVAVLTLAGTLRAHALASLQVAPAGEHTVLFLAPLASADRQAATAIAIAGLIAADLDDAPRLLYVAPAHWNVPELGLTAHHDTRRSSLQELGSPSTHGNRGGFDRRAIRVLVTDPELAVRAAPGARMLAATVRVRPVASYLLDLESGTFGAATAPERGHWHGIPVPAF